MPWEDAMIILQTKILQQYGNILIRTKETKEKRQHAKN